MWVYIIENEIALFDPKIWINGYFGKRRKITGTRNLAFRKRQSRVEKLCLFENLDLTVSSKKTETEIRQYKTRK